MAENVSFSWKGGRASVAASPVTMLAASCLLCRPSESHFEGNRHEPLRTQYLGSMYLTHLYGTCVASCPLPVLQKTPQTDRNTFSQTRRSTEARRRLDGEIPARSLTGCRIYAWGAKPQDLSLISSRWKRASHPTQTSNFDMTKMPRWEIASVCTHQRCCRQS